LEVLVGGHPLYLREGQRWRCRICEESFSFDHKRDHYDRELRLHGREALLRLLELDAGRGPSPSPSRRP
jgi:hypothetical protein